MAWDGAQCDQDELQESPVMRAQPVLCCVREKVGYKTVNGVRLLRRENKKSGEDVESWSALAQLGELVKKGGFLSHFAGRDKNLIQLSTCRPAALQAAHQDRRVGIQKTAAWTEQRYRERVGLGQNNVVANAK